MSATFDGFPARKKGGCSKKTGVRAWPVWEAHSARLAAAPHALRARYVDLQPRTARRSGLALVQVSTARQAASRVAGDPETADKGPLFFRSMQ